MKHEFSRILNAAAECVVDPVALPLSYRQAPSEHQPSVGALTKMQRPAVLLLHGFTGNPGELKYAAERIAEAGYNVSVPRLPGHGTTGAEFEVTQAEDWLRRSVDAYLDLRAESSSVSLVGLSMGALIAVLMSARLKVNALLMCAPALDVNQRFLPLTPILGKFLRSYRGSYNPENVKPEFRRLAEEYRTRRWVRGAGELYRLQQAARKALPQVVCPITTVLTAADPTVPVSVQTRIHNSVRSTDHQLRVFDGSDHVILNGSAREQVVGFLIERLNSQRQLSSQA